jgi:DNA-binding MarR family transcriptional regulator
MSGTIPERQHAVNSDARSSAGEAIAQLAVRVFRLEGLLTAAGDTLAAPAGQTSARWRVLAAVESGPMTVAQIARAWSLARQSVQRVADLLARDGLVAYEDNPDHQRAKLVRLTGSGAQALAQIQAAQRRWADELGTRLSTADLATATRILGDVIATVADEAAASPST